MSPDEDPASREGRGHGRIDSPSLTGRVRSLGLRPVLRSQDGMTSRTQSTDSRRDPPDENDDVFTPNSSLLPPTDRSEDEFREEAVRLLHPSNQLSSRIIALRSVSQNIAAYSPSTLIDILDVTEDLGQPDASPKAREAMFQLLTSAASIQDLPQDEYQRLFSIVVKPASSPDTESQVHTIIALVGDRRLDIAIQDELKSYLTDTIRSQYVALSDARRRAGKSLDRPRGQIAEEKGLHALLKFISHAIKDGIICFEDGNLINLVQRTVYIAEKTTSKVDMKKAVELLQTLIEVTTIPQSELKPCIEVLCAITNAIHELNELTWNCLMLLLSSSKQGETIQILLDTLSLAPTDRHSHTVCGALGVLLPLVSQSNVKLPKVSFSRFIESLWGVHFASRRIRRDCLKTIRSLLLNPDLMEEIRSCSWDHLVQIILTAVGDDTYIHDRTSDPLTIRQYAAYRVKDKSAEQNETAGEVALADDIYEELQKLSHVFNTQWRQLTPEQRQLVSLFYYKLRLVLPASQIQELLKQLDENDYFRPRHPQWQSHQIEMLRLFLWDRDMDGPLSCFIIQTLKTSVNDAAVQDLEHFHMLILRLLNELEGQVSIPVANELTEFARTVWLARIPSNLSEDLDRFWPLLSTLKDHETEKKSKGIEEASDEVVTTFVTLFLDYFERGDACATAVYQFLVDVAKSQEVSSISRLQALRLLARLRCSEKGNVLIVNDPDMLGLAVHVSRSESPSPQSGMSSGDRFSESEETLHTRTTRASTLSHSSQGTVRGSLRIPSAADRHPKLPPPRPLWMYPGPPGLPRFPSNEPSKSLFASNVSSESSHLRLSEWLIAIIDILQQSGDWEVYSYVLVHLPSQLSNPSLFTDATPHIKMLRNVIAAQLLEGHFQEAPPEMGVKKGDIAVCLFSALSMLLAYSDDFARTEQDDMVRAFIAGIWAWERTPKVCVQAIAIACHQIPASVTRHLQVILQRMSQVVTQSQLSVDILEFLGGLARLPAMYVNFREDDYRLVFGICVRYLEHARDQRIKISGPSSNSIESQANRISGISARSAPSSEQGVTLDIQRDLPQYVFALTHHVITIWFLSVRLADRSNHVTYITSNLMNMDPHQDEVMEEQSQVTLDMMHRTAYLDLGETIPSISFSPTDGKTLKKNWLVGMSIVTIETAVSSGLTLITKRQASGTTYATYYQQTAPLPPHHVAGPSEYGSSLGPEHNVQVFPNHVLLQLLSTIAPIPKPMEPICLPDDDIIRRALAMFDRNDTVDGYKIGVIYVGPGQVAEAAILANTQGSAAYATFLEGLGTKVRLKDASFNTQGLDRNDDSDGLYTYAWRDRITELVFHITTMMPTDLDTDPACVLKKRHIGNDFVKIIFNESGKPFEFDTFTSQFNYVNIVITPEAGCQGAGPNTLDSMDDNPPRASYYTVQTITNDQLPDISPAATRKLLALSQLPVLVRHIALHSVVFSNVWVSREGGEHVSSWRNRLREIVKLRRRFTKVEQKTSHRGPEDEGPVRSYVSGDPFHGKVGMGGILEEGNTVASLDFSRWVGSNHSL